MTAAGIRSGARPRAVFFGSPAFAVPCLRAVAAETELVAVVSQPDRPAGRGQAPAAPAVKREAQALGVPILQPEKIRTPETHAALAALAADLFVVVAYGRILPQTLLDLPRLGPFNVHASLLPRLRGAAPIQWSIIRGERETGVSIMRMEAGLDTGPVAAVRALEIADDDTTGTLSAKLAELGARLLVDTLPAIVSGTVALQRQDDGAATLAPLLAKVDGIVNFDQPARLVSAQARGVDPWPGATTTLGGESLKLFAPRIVEPASVEVVRGQQPPGLIRDVTADGLLVSCADDGQLIAFAELQFPGKRRMPAALARDRLPPGTRLGT
jgi:methionyl-tRNA formyltransferase